MISQHNEPSLTDIRKFIHRIALEDELVQDVILMPQHDKWFREDMLENCSSYIFPARRAGA